MIELDSNSFDESVMGNATILIDFWAPWCGPCKQLHPILDELATETSLPIAKINVDENTDIASKYNVVSIPTMIVFENGLPAKTIIGAMPKHRLVKELEGWI